jgi:hypothetical protein
LPTPTRAIAASPGSQPPLTAGRWPADPSRNAALFAVGKSLIGLYIGKSGVTSIYGAAGSVIVILLWVVADRPLRRRVH